MTVAGANSGAAANGSGQAGASGTRSLSIRGLSKEYVRGKPVLRGISLDIAGQGITAIIGDRKSTRLNSSHVSESRMPSSA